jgi:hypothetical protein
MKRLLSSLVEDMDLYPRHAVDDVHVSGLAQALEAGDTLPPIVIDEASSVIVDGWHRVRAYRRVYGPECQVEVEAKRFENRKAMILEAIRLNSSHGRKLDRTDMVRASVMAQQAGASIEQISFVLHITKERVRELRLRVAQVSASSEDAAPRTTFVPLKASVSRLFSGKRMTLEQAAAHRSMPGTSFSRLCLQIRKAIENNFLDMEDEPLMKELRTLHEALGRFLKKAA